MRNLRELSIDELLILEDDWWEREDESDSKWISEGIKIFTRLKFLQQRDIRFTETLAYLHLLIGERQKIIEHSFMKARDNLERVVRLDNQNARAHYRLGFVHFHHEHWAKSIDAFTQSLESKPRSSRNIINKEQEIKAHYYIMKSVQIIQQESLQRVAKIPPEDITLFDKMACLLEEINEYKFTENKPYQSMKNGTEFEEITESEYGELSDPFENMNEVILNYYSVNDATFSFKGKEINIPKLQIPLLELLMNQPNGVSKEEIVTRMYRNSRDAFAVLRRNISRLRERLKSVEPNMEYIITVDGGYKFSTPCDYRILKHQRNVGTEMLLD